MRFLILKIAILALPLSYCSSKKKAEPPDTEPRKVYFYPKANVYFDTKEQEYLFFDSIGMSWQENKNLPDSIRGRLEKNVVLEKEVPPVWKNNEQHRLVYSATLYATKQDLEEKEPEPIASASSDSPKSGQQAGTAGADPEPQKESGLKRFFKKLFGKKKFD
jgi:hypothetical protein